MKINIPEVMDLESILKFCGNIDNLDQDEEYVYDYAKLKRAEPFGMLLLSSKIRNFVDNTRDSNHKDINFKNDKYVTKYIAHMGFFQSVYQNYGKVPGEAKGSKTYIPITELNFDDIRNDGEDPYAYIEKTSKAIAGILACNDNNLKDYLKYSTRELIRNVFEHSESKNFWYVGQYWRSKNIVEVAILDEGIGMQNSFKRNKKISVTSDEEAIKLAIEPGISRSGIGREGREIYDNNGLGLYMISNFCKIGGDIAICSGKNCLLINDSGTKSFDTSFNGTAIRIRFNSNRMGKISDIIRELSQKGTEDAKEYKKLNRIDINKILLYNN